MTDLTTYLQDFRQELREYEKACLKDIKKAKASTGQVEFNMQRGKLRMYHKIRGKRIYISAKDFPKFKNHFQKSYSQLLLRQIQKQLKPLEKLLKVYNPMALQRVYERMSDARKQMVTPIVPDGEALTREFYEKFTPFVVPEDRKDPAEYQNKTNRKELVRSKSEKIIADALDAAGVPYLYEVRLELGDRRSVVVDFVILNVRTGKVCFYEHLGIMGDPGYANRNTDKVNAYILDGYIPGDNFLYTFETGDRPLNSEVIQVLIEKYWK